MRGYVRLAKLLAKIASRFCTSAGEGAEEVDVVVVVEVED